MISWMETLYVDLSGVEDFVRLDGWDLKVIRRGLDKQEPGVYFIWFLAIYIDEVLPPNYFYQAITVLPEAGEEEDLPWIPDEPEEEEPEEMEPSEEENEPEEEDHHQEDQGCNTAECEQQHDQQ